MSDSGFPSSITLHKIQTVDCATVDEVILDILSKQRLGGTHTHIFQVYSFSRSGFQLVYRNLKFW